MENYFYDALHNFIFEEAGGGAIRHLADGGYTARQITDALSFPIPYEKVREALTKYLLECGVLQKERPGICRRPEKTEYVREYDRYGKPSFRRVTVSENMEYTDCPDAAEAAGNWREMELSEFLLLCRDGRGAVRLPSETAHRESEKNIYIGCDFGKDEAGELLQVLDRAQKEYIQGICWTKKTMYHLLDERMLKIALRLRERGLPAGIICAGIPGLNIKH